MGGALKDRIIRIPTAFDREGGERLVSDMSGFAVAGDDTAAALLRGIGGCSPYLARVIRRDPAFAAGIFDRSPEDVIRDLIDETRAMDDCDNDHLSMQLRRNKARAGLVLGMAELTGALTTLEAARHLSDFADAALARALAQALKGLEEKGFCPVAEIEGDEKRAGNQGAAARCGIAILAMGKLGARELNYSSDIDLIAIYDPDAPCFESPAAARDVAVAAVRRLVRFLNDQTRDGYVFRTDLRLRPDPGVSAIAVNINAAEAYYEAHGQNWERAAFIRARAAAGDIPLGAAFLARLRPFIWRRYLDFAMIDDINAILDQIHDAKGAGDRDFAGYNIKAGYGGIRDIEFLVQTRQLIFGGKDDNLRGSGTLPMIDALGAAGALDDAGVDTLKEAYCELRRIEHALQIINDEQTHTIPEAPEDQARLAALLCDESAQTLSARLDRITRSVSQTHARFVAPKAEVTASAGRLSFVGTEPDPYTVQTLATFGFSDPAGVIRLIAGWHGGELRATRTERARQLLTQMTPRILEAFSEADNPDEAMRGFDLFLRELPAGVQIFSLFAHNREMFDTLSAVITGSPSLARALARRSELVEALTESTWPQPLASAPALAADFHDALAAGETYEALLNMARRWQARTHFDVTAQLVVGALSPADAARQYSTIAETVLTGLLPAVKAETDRRTGVGQGEGQGEGKGAFVILALGRLGARRLTAMSDLDLIYIYQPADDDGAPVDPSTYFGRLVRRYISALSAPTEEGRLYEVDMQLRPSGGAGPVAVSFDAFRRYYENDAWTWERMALTKARVIGGDAHLAKKIRDEINRILARPVPEKQLASDVLDMRARLLEHRKPTGGLDVKFSHGGVVDIDFIAQYGILRWGPDGASLPATDSLAHIRGLAARGHLGADAAEALSNAGELFEDVLQILRASFADRRADENLNASLVRRLTATTGATSLDNLMERLTDQYARVRQIFAAQIGPMGPDSV